MHIVTNKVVKMKKHLPFFRKFRIFSIESEVAVVMLPKFDIESALKNSTFRWVVCQTHKIMICVQLDNKFDWLGFAYGLVYPIPVLEADDKHNEDCVQETFSRLR